MSNEELFDLDFSYITPVQIYLNWVLNVSSPTDTIETDTFYLSYFNETTSETIVVNTGRRMNHVLHLLPHTIYTMFIYSINSFGQQSQNSNSVFVQTGAYGPNTIRTNGFIRVFETTELTQITIEDLRDVVSVSASSDGIALVEPTTIQVVTPTSPKPFYQLYKIDPKGQLFGNTPCTEARFKTRIIVV
jgi:hypothetical protein